ncbi:MAG: PEGA domain-containing protein, partial [bacterium]
GSAGRGDPRRDQATDPPGPPRAPASRGGSSEVVARPAAPDPIPHRLEIVTHPEGAGVVIDSPGGVSQAAATPFSTRVMGGDVEVSVSLEGYNTIDRQVILDQDRRLELWLDPRGLLHHKLGELKTGSNPKQVAFSPTVASYGSPCSAPRGSRSSIRRPETSSPISASAPMGRWRLSSRTTAPRPT